MKKISSLLAILGLTLGILAAKSELVNAQAGRSLTVIPPKYELFSNPGDTSIQKLKVRNDSDVPVTYSVTIEDFSTSGEEGQVVLAEEEKQESYSLASWIELDSKDLILQPKEEKTLQFMINIPKGAEPGGHYASILFQSGSDAVPGGAAVAQRVGSLVLMRVSGNITEDVNIESFSVPSYMENGPVDFSLRIKNNGNVHIRPEGTIIVKNIFGSKVAELPLDSRNVLPGAVRKMDTVWNQERLLGRYTATLVAQYGEGTNKKVLTSAVNFTVASKLAIALIAIGVIGGVGLLITLIAGWKRMSRALKVIATGK